MEVRADKVSLTKEKLTGETETDRRGGLCTEGRLFGREEMSKGRCKIRLANTLVCGNANGGTQWRDSRIREFCGGTQNVNRKWGGRIG